MWTRFVPLRTRFTQLALGLVLAVSLVPVLAACGASGEAAAPEANDAPVVAGARRLDAAKVPGDQLEDLGLDGSHGKAVVYATTQTLDDVAGFYEAGVVGWDVAKLVPTGDQVTAVISSGEEIAVVMAVTGSAAKADPDLTEDETLDIDFDAIGDDETVIVVAQFTCEAETVADCLAVFNVE